MVTFCNITQKATSEGYAHKIFHISPLIVLFSYGKVKDIWELMINFHLGKAKGRSKRGVWSERPKMRVIFAKFPLLREIQTLSHKLLVRQTSNHHHCDWSCPKNWYAVTFKWFWAVLPGQKICVFLRNKYDFQIGNAMEKWTLFWPGRNAQNGLILHAFEFLDMLIPMTQVLRLYIQGYMYSLSW